MFSGQYYTSMLYIYKYKTDLLTFNSTRLPIYDIFSVTGIPV